MLKDKEAVIFDLDGTLVDSMWVWSQIDVDFLGKYKIPIPQGFQKELEGLSYTETAAYFKERFCLEESVEEIKEIWRDMAMDRYCHAVPLKPGVRQFIPYLKEQGIQMAVASSNTESLIEAVLESQGIREYFDCIVTSCQVKKGKPAPDVYLEAARSLGADPSKCLVFEDIVAGLEAGKNAGMTVCAIDDDYSRSQEKEKKACASYFITDYRQVMEGTYEEV
ncbi:MAG: HAD family phosphatase [Eubacteriales bacterium]|nr:HAD family phosphatase [Eubacteriales bacterium]